MFFRTALTERFELSVPVIQAPMAGGGDTPELVAAVSNAGGLGFIGAAYLTPEQIIERGRAVRALTSRPFGINLFAPLPVESANTRSVTLAIEAIKRYYDELGLPTPQAPSSPRSTFDEQVAACLESGASAFSVAFGLIPSKTIAELKRHNLFSMGTATTVDEARLHAESGVDGVIAQGGEAGGHRSTFAVPFESGLVGTIALVPQVVDAVSIPVVASGGIMDGRGIAAALALGASCAQMGTAFLLCEEAGVPQAYKDAIIAATEDQTFITRAFSGRPARGIANRVLRDFEQNPEAILPFPLQNALTRPMRSEAAKQNRSEYLSLWAGQGIRMARKMSAAELVARLGSELDEILARLSVDHR